MSVCGLYPQSQEGLQFFLIWFGALLIPILGVIEAGGGGMERAW